MPNRKLSELGVILALADTDELLVASQGTTRKITGATLKEQVLEGAANATQAELDAHLNDATDAHAATAISASSATLDGAATDVQGVLEELDNSLAGHLADEAVEAAGGPLNARSEGAVGDGVADDGPALQAAINAAQTAGAALYVPAGTYKYSTGLSVTRRGFQLYGAGPGLTTLKPQGSIVGMTIDPSTSSIAIPTLVSGFTVDGDINFGTGLTNVGVSIPNASESIVLRDITLLQLNTGLDTTGQFCRYERVGAENCDVGYYLHQDVTDGGGNNNGWAGVMAQGCRIGFLAKKDSPYPIGTNAFDAGCAFHDNSVCGVYLENCEGFVFISPAHENNGIAGGSPYVAKGATVRKSTWHFYGSKVTATALQWVTGTPDPNLILEQASRLSIADSGGTIINTECDESSKIYFQGHHNLYGRISNVVEWPAAQPSNPTVLLGEPVRTASQMPNTCPAPRSLGFSASGTPTPTIGTDADPDFGDISFVQYAASVGSTTANVISFASTTGTYTVGTANTIAVTFNIRASVDCSLQIRAWTATINHTISLLANKVYRLHIMASPGSVSGAVTVYPTTAAGAKVNIWDCHGIYVKAQSPMVSAFTQQGWFNPVAALPTYAATNVTTDRAYDADTVAVAELADVVGTLIADLRAIGVVI